jgi:hypothetical protein
MSDYTLERVASDPDDRVGGTTYDVYVNDRKIGFVWSEPRLVVKDVFGDVKWVGGTKHWFASGSGVRVQSSDTRKAAVLLLMNAYARRLVEARS